MQALLMLEVNHRAMNALAVVQAVLKLTPKTDVRSYIEAAEGRVAALARAQMLLTRSQWTGIELQTLLMNEILPFGHDKAVLIAGPPVLLAPTAAQPVAMVIHELATNATKHGAFSVGTGQVDISWVVLDKPARWIKLRWVESGGPMILVTPERQGTGTRILNSTIRQQLGGTFALFWNTSGLTCEIDLPISRGKSE
jgi:two-component sensor histidine kinase